MKYIFSDENTLLEKCLAQDKKAWDIFVERYNRLIYKSIVQTLKKYSFTIDFVFSQFLRFINSFSMVLGTSIGSLDSTNGLNIIYFN